MDIPQQSENIYYLQPGYIFVSRKSYLVQTILGSCVSVCLWNSYKKYGGMNHYIYNIPKNDMNKPIYGSVSIRYMIKIMIKYGSNLSEIEGNIVGGARSNTLASSTVGEGNIDIAKKILNEYNISIKKIDVGGENGRKVIFNTVTGGLKIIKLEKLEKLEKPEKLGKE